MATKAEQLFALVEKSPAAVAQHDKAAWLSIFSQYHIVEDPVGSSPHIGGLYDCRSGQRGSAKLDRFFDTFIAPNEIQFDIRQDLVCDQHVVRDVSIHIQMSEQLKLIVPAYLLYEAVHENNAWKITRLAAHWELLPMLKQLFSNGKACLPVVAGLSVRMLRHQGLTGTLGFSKAIFSIGKAGKNAVQAFAEAFNNKELSPLMRVFDNDLAIVHWPYGQHSYSPSELIEQLQGSISLGEKCIAAGDLVVVDATWQEKKGVLFFEFNRKTQRIKQLRAYF